MCDTQTRDSCRTPTALSLLTDDSPVSLVLHDHDYCRHPFLNITSISDNGPVFLPSDIIYNYSRPTLHPSIQQLSPPPPAPSPPYIPNKTRFTFKLPFPAELVNQHARLASERQAQLNPGIPYTPRYVLTRKPKYRQVKTPPPQTIRTTVRLK